MTTPSGEPARYVMIGGFLGAGKSTAMVALASWLRQRGRRVGLITNDQSVGLVDTRLMQRHGLPVEEIAGGCFCCRFDSLVEAAGALSGRERPEVFLAEPVGSCTDLVATVSYPLRRMYGDAYRIAPLSVMVDPFRAGRVLGIEPGRSFSRKVQYVYRKQLEEAELIVINKTDRLDGEDVERLREALAEAFPHAEILAVSARTGEGLDEWFARLIEREMTLRDPMSIDYGTYGEGEGRLGWLNETLRVAAESPFDGEVLMMDMARAIHANLEAAGAEVAHLKMTLIPDHQGGRMAMLSLVRDDFVPELAESLPEQTRCGQLVINLRAEGDPATLREATDEAVGRVAAESVAAVETEHAECFRPAPPQPTYGRPVA